MRKSLIIPLVLGLPLLSASSCHKEKICLPYSVRQDSYKPDRWWVCNSDGTEEKAVPGPEPTPETVKVKARQH